MTLKRTTLAIFSSALAAFGLAAPLTTASETRALATLPFTYAKFEAAVPHIDLETCPKPLPQEESFCRASILNEEIHIFAFSLNDDSPMVGFASFSAHGLDTLFD